MPVRERMERLQWIRSMVAAVDAMPPAQRATFDAWDDARPGDIGTSAWPGFADLIGPAPWNGGVVELESPPRAATLVPKALGKRRVKTPIPRWLSRLVFERDAYRCVGCGSWIDLTCDHIVPEVLGGPTALANLQTMCRSCNCRKGTRTDWP